MRVVGCVESSIRGIVRSDPSFAAENVAKLRDQIFELRALENAVVGIGVSPHAPYTAAGRSFELISRLAIDETSPS